MEGGYSEGDIPFLGNDIPVSAIRRFRMVFISQSILELVLDYEYRQALLRISVPPCGRVQTDLCSR